MNYTLFNGITRSDVLRRVPPALKDSAVMSLTMLPKECDPVSVLVFGNETRQVVVSGDARRAVKDLTVSGRLVGIAVAGSFTREATEMLRQHGFVGCGRTVVDWTDESYQKMPGNQNGMSSSVTGGGVGISPLATLR